MNKSSQTLNASSVGRRRTGEDGDAHCAAAKGKHSEGHGGVMDKRKGCRAGRKRMEAGRDVSPDLSRRWTTTTGPRPKGTASRWRCASSPL